jgi:hypothetical protein
LKPEGVGLLVQVGYEMKSALELSQHSLE